MNRISAKVVADSISDSTPQRLTTLEVIFPRYILAEFNTHRLFTRNSASSRAIPFKKMIRSVKEQLFTPIAWQRDHSGMQGTDYFDGWRTSLNNLIWKGASRLSILAAKGLNKLGVTKQLANRLLEPFLYHKVLVTSSEWRNFFDLRCPVYTIGNNKFWSKSAMKYYWHKNNLPMEQLPTTDLGWLKINKGMGEIHIMDLAEKIFDAINHSTPETLQPGDWHIPYGDGFNKEQMIALMGYEEKNDNPLHDEFIAKQLLEFKLKVSVARCARLSYQTLGDNPVIDYLKDLDLFNVLFKSKHYSPFEHVARLMTEEEYDAFTKGKLNIVEGAEGQEIMINDGISEGWCNNFRGFIQYRWILENEENI